MALFLYKRGNMNYDDKTLLLKICSWENLYAAYQEAAKGKWFRTDVMKFSQNLEENLIEIQNELIWHKYKVGRCREFYVYEPADLVFMPYQFILN